MLATKPSDTSAEEGAGAAVARPQVAAAAAQPQTASAPGLPSADGAVCPEAGSTVQGEGIGSGTDVLQPFQPRRAPQSPTPPRHAVSPVSAPPAAALSPPSMSAIDHACAALLDSSGCGAADAAAGAAGELAAAAPGNEAAASTVTGRGSGAEHD